MCRSKSGGAVVSYDGRDLPIVLAGSESDNAEALE
jgi:hypothetical protein